jgi:hypothetical protein
VAIPIVRVISVLALVAATVPCAQTVSSSAPSSICGVWLVTKVIPTSGVHATENPSWLGREISYSDGEMRTGSRVVQRIRYRTRSQTAAEFYADLRIHLTELGIVGSTVTIIEALDDRSVLATGLGSIVFLKNESEVLTLWDGNFYLMQRKEPRPPSCKD